MAAFLMTGGFFLDHLGMAGGVLTLGTMFVVAILALGAALAMAIESSNAS